MKTRITFLFLLIAVITQAQENYMSLSFGGSTPLNSYAKNNSLSDDGFALQGFMADYSGAYYLIDYIGIGGAIKFNQNVVDGDAIRSELLELLPEDPGDSVSFNLGFWSIVSIGIGPQFTLPIGSKLNLDVYAFPGLHVVTSPKMQLTATINDTTHVRSVTTQNLRFGFETGIGIRYDLNSKYGLRIFASYLQTSSKGEILEEIDGTINPGSTSEFKKNIQIFNAGVGLVIYL